MAPAVSVVVVAYDMARELPRTLHTLDPRRQVGVDGGDYEVVLVDNGSPTPVDPDVLARFSGRLELIRLDPAPPSPARAANEAFRAVIAASWEGWSRRASAMALITMSLTESL